MGSWEIGPFENDAAGDFVAEFGEKGWKVVERTVNRNLTRDDTSNQEVVAACEFISAANGHPRKGESLDELTEWLAENETFRVPSSLTTKAIQRLEALTSKSALLDVWNDAGLQKQWKKTVENLVGRLRKRPIKRPVRDHKKQKPGLNNGPTMADAQKSLKKYDGATLKQKGIRVVVVNIPRPKDARALLALTNVTILCLSPNESLAVSEQIESVRVLLQGWRSFTSFELEQFNGLDACVDELATHAERIEELQLTRCRINSRVGEVLCSFSKLKHLYLKECGIDDRFVKDLCQKCTHLGYVAIIDRKLTQKSLAPLGTLKNLTELAIGYPGVSENDGRKFVKKHAKMSWSMELVNDLLVFNRKK